MTPKEKKFATIKLSKETIEGMISTYEFLAWQNKGTDDGKKCSKILKALKKAIEK